MNYTKNIFLVSLFILGLGLCANQQAMDDLHKNKSDKRVLSTLLEKTLEKNSIYAIKEFEQIIAKDGLTLGDILDVYHIKSSTQKTFDIVELLVNNYEKINSLTVDSDCNALMLLLKTCTYKESHLLKLVKILVQKGENVNHQEDSGSTLLGIAIEKDYYDIVKFLVESGADKSAKNKICSCFLKGSNHGYVLVTSTELAKGMGRIAIAKHLMYTSDDNTPRGKKGLFKDFENLYDFDISYDDKYKQKFDLIEN